MGGYHPAKLKKYNTFLAKTGNAEAIPVLRMMNVKYLISPQKINNPELSLVKSGALKSARGDLPIEVYEVNNTLPRAWFVNKTEVVSEEDVWNKIMQPDFDPRNIAYVPNEVSVSSGSQVSITHFEKGIHRLQQYYFINQKCFGLLKVPITYSLTKESIRRTKLFAPYFK